MLWVLIRIAYEYPQHLFLWRTDENYPSIVIKYPHYLVFWTVLRNFLNPHVCFAEAKISFHMGRVKPIWYLSPMRAAKARASLRIRAVSPEPSLLAHTSSKSRGTFRQKARSLAPPNGWACPVKICHDGMLKDTNLLDEPHMCFSQPLGDCDSNSHVCTCFDGWSGLGCEDADCPGEPNCNTDNCPTCLCDGTSITPVCR